MDAWAMPLCICSWGFFVSYELAIGLDRILSTEPLCPHSDSEYGPWYNQLLSMVFGGFVWMLVHLIQRIIAADREGAHTIPMMVALNIVTIATVCTFLATVGWGGTCIDKLNYASHASLWGEWIACGPLVVYTILAISDEPDLTREDWFILGSFTVCLIAGWVIIPEQPMGWAWFSFAVSCVAYMPMCAMPYCIHQRFHHCQSPHHRASRTSSFNECASELTQTFSEERMTRCYNAAVLMNILLPLYTVFFCTSALLDFVCCSC